MIKPVICAGLLGALISIAACSKKAEAPPPETAAPVRTSVPDSWNGKYEGDLIITISGTAPAHKAWLLEAAGDGCTGDMGVADGGIKAITDAQTLIVAAQVVDKGECKITLTRSGNTITARETEPCAAFHGPTCSFNGTATRVK